MIIVLIWIKWCTSFNRKEKNRTIIYKARVPFGHIVGRHCNGIRHRWSPFGSITTLPSGNGWKWRFNSDSILGPVSSSMFQRSLSPKAKNMKSSPCWGVVRLEKYEKSLGEIPSLDVGHSFPRCWIRGFPMIQFSDIKNIIPLLQRAQFDPAIEIIAHL